jgi:uncharacterized membrane protein (UPF0127 family)
MYDSTVTIADVVIPVEIVSTAEDIARGLGKRKSLEASTGMLFLFDHSAVFKFWMKGMRFAIDIIWIGESMKIVDITKNLMPVRLFEKVRFHSPKVPARYVLEVNAGFCEKHRIAVGDAVTFNSIPV